MRNLAALGATAAPAVPALAKALRDPEMQVRFTAAVCLGALGAQAVSALPALRQTASDPHGAVRVMARDAIKTIERSRGP